MDWLNYHHLYYFSVIAQEGGVAPAARKLRLSHSTLSTQLGALEAHLGLQLFERRARRLVLTSFGADALRYAEDIFRLGRELNDVAHGRSSPRRDILRVGAVAGLPKTLVHRLLGPVLEQETGTLVVQQDRAPILLELLVAGRIHAALLNEVPAPPTGTRVYSHALGETDILLYARARLAQAVRRNFPGALSNVPFLLPPAGAPLRRRLDAWFVEHDLRIVAKAEVEDAGLLRVLGSAGRGIFPVRAAVRAEVEDLRDVQLVGACSGVRERYYLVTTERRVRQTALAALIENARNGLNTVKRVENAR